MISILILTLNEELNLPTCLSSLSWCDDVVVLDSFSVVNLLAEFLSVPGCKLLQDLCHIVRLELAVILHQPAAEGREQLDGRSRHPVTYLAVSCSIQSRYFLAPPAASTATSSGTS